MVDITRFNNKMSHHCISRSKRKFLTINNLKKKSNIFISLGKKAMKILKIHSSQKLQLEIKIKIINSKILLLMLNNKKFKLRKKLIMTRSRMRKKS